MALARESFAGGIPMRRREFLATAAAAVVLPVSKMAEAAAERHLLYIAEPGIRNYVEYGGVGVLVYDIGAGYKFVKRIPTWTVPAGQEPENVKGVAASAKTGRIFVTTIKRLCAHRSGHGEDGLGGGARGRLRSPGDLARRDDALRAVARGSALARHERAGRQHHQEDRDRTPARTTPSYSLDGSARRTWPGCTRRCCRWRTRRRTPSSRPSVRSAT